MMPSILQTMAAAPRHAVWVIHIMVRQPDVRLLHCGGIAPSAGEAETVAEV